MRLLDTQSSLEKIYVPLTINKQFTRSASKKIAVLFAVLFLFITEARSQSCDTMKACAGNAITITYTQGKGAQWVEVDTNWRLRSIDTAITFEAWIKPQQQPGKRIWIAGLWGPNKDNNDVWVVALEGTQISFALSQDGSYKGDLDNTVAIASVPNIYTKGWTHLACIWDAVTQEARIYIDGYEFARSRNAQYPVTKLHPQDNKQLPLLIGSSNSMFDDTVRYRTFLGQIDEVRLWRRALSETEVRCQRNKSLEGNERDLELYYRANDTSGTPGVPMYTLCDASGNGHGAKLLGGARLQWSDRRVPATFSVSPPSVDGTLVCINDTTFNFTITDTSFCGNTVYAYCWDPYGYYNFFTVSPNSFNLQQNVPQSFTVRLRNVTFTGDILTNLYIVNYNRCGEYIYVPLTLKRRTEIEYSKGSIRMDTLYVGCTEKPYAEDSVTLCNRTTRPMQIADLQLKNPKYSWRPGSGQPALPITLQPGECWRAIVRMDNHDTTKTHYDTLRIISDDRCPGSGFIPIEGRTQDVFVLLTPNAQRQIKSMAFEDVCPGQISNVQLYQYRSLLLGEDVFIDSIYFTDPAFFGRRFTFPIRLRPKTAYIPQFVRFRPPTPGPFSGEMHVIARYRGCTIDRSISLTGRGISVDVQFDNSNVVFGNVSVGKSSRVLTPVTSTGKDLRRMSSYLKVGDVFSIVANRSFVINPGQTLQITVEFRPREPKTYYDTLCIFDEQCYGTLCIPISGTGVFEQLQFTPPFVNIENVVGCECRTDSALVKNISGANITITGDALNDPSGKYTLLNRAPVGTLANGASFWYKVKYCPNDLADERADRSYITINLSGNSSYEVLLQGTSIVPKLYLTPLIAYGQVEVGWQKNDSMLIENITSVPVHVASIVVPSGYALTGTSKPLPVWLAPRDSFFAYIQFLPTAASTYLGNVVATIDTPCGRQYTGVVSGKGAIVKLEVPVTFINYGLVKPCDCIEREIPLPNNSNFIPISIDSISIDSAGLANPNEVVFRWRSKRTGQTSGSFVIPPGEADTLVIIFCPNIPAAPQNLVMNAQITIRASTPGWKDVFKTVLSGRREMNFQPNVQTVQFPTTRVDTNAQTIRVRIQVPNAFTNPSGDSIVFTNAYFVPDERVFTVQECSGKPLPWVVQRGDTLCLDFDFRPRAPKFYEARLHLETTFPCSNVDTTILVKGEGNAPAFGIQAAFDTSNIGNDTFRITTCDTLILPIMITRDLPQDVIDMLFRIGYDTNAVRLLDIITPYTTEATIADTGDGARAYLRNARNVKAGYIAYVRFIPRGDTARFPIFLDEIEFASDSLVFFKIVAGIDRGFVMIDDPQIEISPLAAFDTVNIKSCRDQFVTVRNPGLVPIQFDSLSTLPPYHRVTASSIPYPVVLQPGDSVILTVTFCPWAEGWIDTTIYAYSNDPCPIEDTGRVRSYGYAPPFPMTLSFDLNFEMTDTVGGSIKDTIEVPIEVDRDVPLSPIDLRYDVFYNRRALKYLGAASAYVTPTVTPVSGGLTIEMTDCDSVKRGEIARLRFVVAVPDSIVSLMYISPGVFTSDSVLFIKPVPAGDSVAVKVGSRCNISYLEFRGGSQTVTVPRPNPTTGRIEFEAEFYEDVPVRLTLTDTKGSIAMQVLDGSALMQAGRYKYAFDAGSLPNGAYILTFEGGRLRKSYKILIIH